MSQIVRSHFPHPPLASCPRFCVRGDRLSSFCAACGGSTYTDKMEWFSKVGSIVLLLRCFIWHVRGLGGMFSVRRGNGSSDYWFSTLVWMAWKMEAWEVCSLGHSYRLFPVGMLRGFWGWCNWCCISMGYCMRTGRYQKHVGRCWWFWSIFLLIFFKEQARAWIKSEIIHCKGRYPLCHPWTWWMHTWTSQPSHSFLCPALGWLRLSLLRTALSPASLCESPETPLEARRKL
jgi:hypothetical protein